MICAHLDNAAERGEPVAGLWASEPGICVRFGFGLASDYHDVNAHTRHMTTLTVANDVQLSMLPVSKIPDVVRPY
jgi:predicted acetyltransferase